MRFLFIVLLFLSSPVFAGQVVPGPVLADVVRVVDGDTIDVSYSQSTHRNDLGGAIWVYKYLEKIASPKTRRGGTKKSLIASELKVTTRTIKRHLSTLRENGYIKTHQVQHGFEFEILKPVDMASHMRIRVDGLDTPELKGKCAEEKQRARDAKEFVIATLKGKRINLLEIRNGKFAGRQVARVVIAGTGDDLADLVIKNNHGRPYGGGKRRGWCE